MILVDTSIWVEFLKQNPDFTKEMISLLEDKKVLAFEPVFSELIYVSRNKKEKAVILSFWNVLPRIKMYEGSFLESAEYANTHNYHNLGVGLIDALLTKATIDNNCRIWTLDKKILSNLDNRFIYNRMK